MELRDIDTINAELDLALPGEEGVRGNEVADANDADAGEQTAESGEDSPVVVQVVVDTSPESKETLH